MAIKRDLSNWKSFAGLSIEEYAAVTGISVSLTRKEIKAGRLKAVRVGERRLVIPVSEIKSLINAVNE